MQEKLSRAEEDLGWTKEKVKQLQEKVAILKHEGAVK